MLKSLVMTMFLPYGERVFLVQQFLYRVMCTGLAITTFKKEATY